MPGYRADPTRPDKAKAIAGVTAVYAIIVGAALVMPADSPLRLGTQDPTVLIDINELPEPQPPPETQPGKAEEEEGAAGKKADPTPVVTPKPRIEVPAKSPVAAAPISQLLPSRGERGGADATPSIVQWRRASVSA